MDDLDNYALEQAKVEVDQTRSWPTKILAFYSAINAVLVAAYVAASGAHPLLLSTGIRVTITVVISVLLIWAVALLIRNHLSYLRYRNMQIRFQRANEDELKKRFPVPDDWFKENQVCITTRWQGWSFYAYLALLVTAAALLGVWAK
jgi:hypothetical protein